MTVKSRSLGQWRSRDRDVAGEPAGSAGNIAAASWLIPQICNANGERYALDPPNIFSAPSHEIRVLQPPCNELDDTFEAW